MKYIYKHVICEYFIRDFMYIDNLVSDLNIDKNTNKIFTHKK